MTAPNKIRNIALSQSSSRPTNVRKTPATAAEDVAREASIRAHLPSDHAMATPNDSVS